MGAIPLDPPNYTLSVRGKISITFIDNGPVVIEVDGFGAVHGFQIASAKLLFQTDGYFEVDGAVDINLSVAEVKAGLSAFVDLPAKEFSADVQGQLLIGDLNIASAETVISSIGTAACASTLGGHAGFGYHWGGNVDVSIGIGGCHISGYVATPVSAAATRAGTRPIAVPAAANAPFEDIAVRGASGPRRSCSGPPPARRSSPPRSAPRPPSAPRRSSWRCRATPPPT